MLFKSIIIIVIIFTCVGKNKNSDADDLEGYVTTLMDFNEYSKIENQPIGKEIGQLKNDSVVRVKRVYKKDELTWIYCYTLNPDDEVDKVYICIPEEVNIMEENKYVLYNKNSRTWNAHYQRVDEKNKLLLEKYQKEFLESIKNIKISEGSDDTEIESIIDTSWILGSKGYMDLFVSDGKTFYYIDKNDKKFFLDNYKFFSQKYESEKIKYF